MNESWTGRLQLDSLLLRGLGLTALFTFCAARVHHPSPPLLCSDDVNRGLSGILFGVTVLSPWN